jgi:cellulose synthase/poly-beta-1,6-N-acetylglucosamine synthase-like glycosyltransferase
MASHFLLVHSEWAGRLALALWWLAQGYVLLFFAYVLAPALVYLLFPANIKCLFRTGAPRVAQTSFVLLIPAHNEQELLPGLLASIGRLNYPAARFRAVVVADNCTDGTAALARQAGALCFERSTPEPSNKSQALLYAAQALGITTQQSEAVVCVLDADCSLDPQFLAELDRHFAQPGAAPVVQCGRYVSNAFDSDVTVLDAAAEALRQYVGAGARQLLGLEAMVAGLGCCMRQDIFAQLMALPVTSLAEDKEWKAYLSQQQVPVSYCPAARLSYQAVCDRNAFRKQRKRWLSGYVTSVRTHGLAMLGQGLRRGNLSQLDFAFDLLQMPRSCLLLAALVFGAAAGAEPWALVSGWVWLGLAAGLLGYAMLGLRLIGAAPRHFLALLYGGRLVAGVAKSMVLIVIGYKAKDWDATRQ